MQNRESGHGRTRIVRAMLLVVRADFVVRDGDGPRSRYRMLAPIAEYASRKLAASDELGPASMWGE